MSAYNDKRRLNRKSYERVQARANRLRSNDLLGISELCTLFAIDRDTLRAWRISGEFPRPDLILSGSPGWRRGVVLEWLARTSGVRLPAA